MYIHILTTDCVINRSSGSWQSLQELAKQRRARAFAEGTRANQKAQIELFLLFLTFYNIGLGAINTSVLCAYVEYLIVSFATSQSVKNYFSGVKLLFKLMEWDTSIFDSFQLSLMMKGASKSLPKSQNFKMPITIDILCSLISACTGFSWARKLKFALLAGFFGFFRQANLAPYYARSFNFKKHTCRQDIIVTRRGLLFILKWTKTLQ